MSSACLDYGVARMVLNSSCIGIPKNSFIDCGITVKIFLPFTAAFYFLLLHLTFYCCIENMILSCNKYHVISERKKS